jgi:hypothetical protein
MLAADQPIPENRPPRVREIWRCNTDGCLTRYFYPGPLCPRCHQVGTIESKRKVWTPDDV